MDLYQHNSHYDRDKTITVPLRDTTDLESPATVLDTQPMREVDEFSAMQTLYLLDRFGVSDKFYHELTQVIVVLTIFYNRLI